MGAPQLIDQNVVTGTPVGTLGGTTNTIPRWTGPSTLGDSGLIDNGTAIYTTTRDVGFGIASPNAARFQSVGVDDKWAARLHGSTTVGKSYGALIEAGTNSGDIALRVRAAGAGSDYLYVRGDGNVGIGTTSPAALLDASSGKTVGTGGFRVGADVSATTRTNNTRKIGSLSVPHYDNSASDASLMSMDTNTTTNTLYIGGGWAQNAATSILFYTGATSTTTTGTERARIDSSGNVGIGTASPGARLHVLSAADEAVKVVSSTSGVIVSLFSSTTALRGYIGTANSLVSGGNAADLAIRVEGSNNIVFATSTTERARITTTALDISSTSGYGLKLPATPGNTDPNTLDCYADGGTANSGGVTWTPAITFGGASTGITYQTQVGRYTRVGNMVFATCYLVLTSKGTATGNVKITGLPTSSNTTSLFTGATVGYFANITSTGQVMGYMPPNDTGVILNQTTAVGANTALTDANFANNSAIIVTIAYPVT